MVNMQNCSVQILVVLVIKPMIYLLNCIQFCGSFYNLWQLTTCLVFQYPLGLFKCNENKTQELIRLLKELTEKYVPLRNGEVFEAVFLGGENILFLIYLHFLRFQGVMCMYCVTLIKKTSVGFEQVLYLGGDA